MTYCMLPHTTCDVLFATSYLLHGGTGTGTNVALEGFGCAAWCGVLGLGYIHTIYPFYCTIRVFFFFICGIEEKFLIRGGYDQRQTVRIKSKGTYIHGKHEINTAQCFSGVYLYQLNITCIIII